MSPGGGSRLIRPLVARDPGEAHRVASPLELLTDLCFVVAVSQAAAGLHHAIVQNQVGEGVLQFVLVFFGVFWAWVNFTWFGSAYDNDDLAYRLLTILQIVGSLVYAAGIPNSFAGDFRVCVVGYVIMRIALVSQWLRAARHDRERRRTALRFAGGIAAVQTGWIVFTLAHGTWQILVFVLLACCEMAIPPFAESAGQTTWHPHHVAERYSLFYIIVLGETILSTTVAVQAATDEGLGAGDLIALLAGGVLLVFSLWWLYFSRDDAEVLRGGAEPRMAPALEWGYGHYLVFAPAAALGAGLSSLVDHDTGASKASALVSGAAVTIPVAILVCAVFAVHLSRHEATGRSIVLVGPAIVLVLAGTWTPVPEVVAGVVCACLVALIVARGLLAPTPSPPGGATARASGHPLD